METPFKKTIDFKVLNLASLNNRFDNNISRQSSKISEKKSTGFSRISPFTVPFSQISKQIAEGSAEISRSASQSSAESITAPHKKRYVEIQRKSQMQVIKSPPELMRTIDPRKQSLFKHPKFLQSPPPVIEEIAPMTAFTNKKFSSSQKPQPIFGNTVRIQTNEIIKNRIISNSLAKNQLYRDRKFIKKPN